MDSHGIIEAAFVKTARLKGSVHSPVQRLHLLWNGGWGWLFLHVLLSVFRNERVSSRASGISTSESGPGQDLGCKNSPTGWKISPRLPTMVVRWPHMAPDLAIHVLARISAVVTQRWPLYTGHVKDEQSRMASVGQFEGLTRDQSKPQR